MFNEEVTSYNLQQHTRNAAAEILNGKAKPQDMAIRSQKQFKAVVNQKKANQLGIKIPEELLKGAEVIK